MGVTVRGGMNLWILGIIIVIEINTDQGLGVLQPNPL